MSAPSPAFQSRRPFIALIVAGLILAGIYAVSRWSRPAAPEVVVYCALDREFSAPVLERFEAETGIHPVVKFDTESTKSVGLAEQLRREAVRPRADVFWNNEAVNTVRLGGAGVLVPYAPRHAAEYPPHSRASDGSWHGLAARARVLLVNTTLVDEADVPATLDALADDRFRDRVGMAKPLFGTTATQMAALFAVWGPDRTREWLGRLQANRVRVLAGNKQVAVSVGDGRLALGLTDTDDALAEIAAGRPVRMTFPQVGGGVAGVLVIPNTVALIRNGPNPDAGRRLLDFLLSPRVEELLARGPSAQIPLHPDARPDARVQLPPGVIPVAVDWTKVAAHWDDAMTFLKAEFTTD